MKDFDETFRKQIGKEGLTLVDFFATWCGPCKAMHPILTQLKEKLGDQVHIMKVDVDLPEHGNVISHYNIASVPTLILFRAGKALWRGSGVVSAEYLKGIIEQARREPRKC